MVSGINMNAGYIVLIGMQYKGVHVDKRGDILGSTNTDTNSKMDMDRDTEHVICEKMRTQTSQRHGRNIN